MKKAKFLYGGFILLVLFIATNIRVFAKTNTDDSYGRIEQKKVIDNPELDVQLDYGIDGYAVYDRGSVVRLYISSVSDFDGTVSVQSYYSYPGDYETQNTRYTKTISISAGDETSVEFGVDTLGSGKIKVDICGTDGKVVYSEVDSLSIYSDDMTAVVAVLSDNQGSLSYIDDINIENASDDIDVKKLNVSKEEVPDSRIGLEAAEYMLIDDFDTAALSDSQYDAIKNWVYDGGILILSLGADGERVMGRFDDGFLNWSIDGTDTGDITCYNTDGTEISALSDVEISRITVDGGEIASDMCDGADIYSRNIGYGKIIVLPYSLNVQIINTDVSKSITKAVLQFGYTKQVNHFVQRDYYDGNTYGIDSAIDQNKKDTPSPLVIMVILIVYIVICGPVMYIVLKKRRKQELIWLTVPACALLGTFAIYLVGLKYRVEKPIDLSFSATDISGDTKRDDIYSYVIGSKAGAYDLKVKNEYNNVEFENAYTNIAYDRSSSSPVLEKSETADGVNVKYNSDIPFGNVCLTASEISENDIGHLDSSLKLYTDGFEGNITNNTSYDIKDFVVMSEGYFYCADMLAAGATVSIDRKDNIKLKPGVRYYSMGTYYTDRYGKDYEEDDDLFPIISRNYYMMLRKSGENVYNSSQGVVAMWGSVDGAESVISGEDTENYNNSVIYSIGCQKYEDVDGAYYDSIYDLVSNVSGQSDYDADDLMMYSDEVEMTIKFENKDNIKQLMYDTDQSDSKSRIVVKDFNNETGQYDTIFNNGRIVLNGRELDKYLVDNTIVMRFIAPQQGEYYTENYLPHISAIGGNR